MMNSRKWRSRLTLTPRTLWGVLGFFALSAALSQLLRSPLWFEPDQLYHLSLLREMKAQGALAPREWSQFPLLGWENFFIDKEFLFHALLYPFYLAAGEAGVRLGLGSFVAALLLLPLWAMRSIPLALLTSGALFLHPYFAFRFGLLRAYVLAALCLAVITIALRQRSAWATGLACACFALAYHAIYVPAALLLIAIPFGFRRPALAGAAGLAAGVLLHPSFPANLLATAQTAGIALKLRTLADTHHLRFGTELLPIPGPQYLSMFGGVLLALTASLVLRWRAQRNGAAANAWHDYLLLVVTSGWLVAWLSPRLLELLLPLTVLLLVSAAEQAATRWRWLPLALLLPFTAWHAGTALKAPLAPTAPSIEIFRALLARLPEHENIRIFHTNWAHSPYMIFLRPQARVIDILDPTYLFLANPALSSLMAPLTAGRVADPVSLLQTKFGAQYALCEPSPLALQLAKSEGVELVGQGAGLYLFRLNRPL